MEIDGKTFRAYKLFDVTYSGDAYSYTIAPEFAGFTYEGKSGAQLVDLLSGMADNSTELNAFAAAALQYVVTNGIAPKGSAAAVGQTAVIDLSEAGY